MQPDVIGENIYSLDWAGKSDDETGYFGSSVRRNTLRYYALHRLPTLLSKLTSVRWKKNDS